jgi:hypothetical protein
MKKYVVLTLVTSMLVLVAWAGASHEPKALAGECPEACECDDVCDFSPPIKFWELVKWAMRLVNWLRCIFLCKGTTCTGVGSARQICCATHDRQCTEFTGDNCKATCQDCARWGLPWKLDCESCKARQLAHASMRDRGPPRRMEECSPPAPPPLGPTPAPAPNTAPSPPGRCIDPWYIWRKECRCCAAGNSIGHGGGDRNCDEYCGEWTRYTYIQCGVGPGYVSPEDSCLVSSCPEWPNPNPC